MLPNSTSGNVAQFNAGSFERVFVDNVVLNNLLFGMYMFNSTDVNTELSIRSTEYNQIVGNAISITNINGLTIQDNTFFPMPQNSVAVAASNTVNNSLLERCRFNGCSGSVQLWSFWTYSNNLTFNKCEFLNGTFQDINLISFNNVQIIDCTFQDITPAIGAIAYASDFLAFSFSPSTFMDAQGLLIDRCTFRNTSTNPQGFVPYQAVRTIQIGSELPILFCGCPVIGARDVIIRNSTFGDNNSPTAPFGIDIQHTGLTVFLSKTTF